MITVSTAMRKAMAQNTDFKQIAKLTLADGTILDIPQSDVIVNGNSITSGSGISSIPLGVAVARTVRLEIANFNDKYSDYDFYGCKIELKLQYTYDGQTSTIPYGVFTVITPETMGTTIAITGVDDMYKADKPYASTLPFPATAARVWQDACSECGIAVQTVSFTNDDFVIQKPTDCTYREVLGGIALLAGGNAIINRNGRIEIKTFNMSRSKSLIKNESLKFKPWDQSAVMNGGYFNPWETGTSYDGGGFVSAERFYCHILYAWLGDPVIDTDDITVTGVSAELDGDNRVLYGDEGYILSISSPCMTGKEEETVQAVGPIIVGMKLRMFNGTYIGDPTIEFMDDCVVVDRKGNCYSSFVTDVTYNLRGSTSIKNSAEPVLRNGMTYSGTTRTIQRARRLIERRMSAYDIGIQNLARLMSASIGFFYTKEEQGDGSIVFYIHDQPTMAESHYIYKRTADGYAQSTDGGQTWNSGVDKFGNAVMNTVAAKKVSADWIDTGSLLVGDLTNPVFLADIDQERVVLNGYRTIDGTRTRTLHIDTYYGEYEFNPTSFAVVVGGTSQSLQNYVDARSQTAAQGARMTNEEVLRAFMGNTSVQGIFTDVNGHLYINMAYLRSGEIDIGGFENELGRLRIKDVHGNVIIVGDSGGIRVNGIAGTGQIAYIDINGNGVSSVLKDDTDFAGGYYNELRLESGILENMDENGYSHGYLTFQGLIGDAETGEPSFKGVDLTSETGMTLRTGYNNYGFSIIHNDDVGQPEKTSFKATKDQITHGVPTVLNGEVTINGSVNFSSNVNDGIYMRLPQGQPTSGIWVVAFDQSASTDTKLCSVYITPSTQSSKRYKDIDREITSKDIIDAYNIKVYSAKYKEGFLDARDQREGIYYPMFVAEQMQEHLPIAVDLNKDGLAETWNERVIIPVMFQLIKDQKEQLDAQAKKIEDLESRLSRLEALIGGKE